MISNEERREVAERLRVYSHDFDFSDSAPFWYVSKAVFGDVDAHTYCSVFARLADLIDPDRDLTCELEPTASERTDAPVRVYECDCCGKSCDVVYAEDYVYCPYCGRLNTAREVEVEE